MEAQNNKEYNCPVEYTLSKIGGKWKPVILWYLANNGIKRYGEIKKILNGITHKMLRYLVSWGQFSNI